MLRGLQTHFSTPRPPSQNSYHFPCTTHIQIIDGRIKEMRGSSTFWFYNYSEWDNKCTILHAYFTERNSHKTFVVCSVSYYKLNEWTDWWFRRWVLNTSHRLKHLRGLWYYLTDCQKAQVGSTNTKATKHGDKYGQLVCAWRPWTKINNAGILIGRRLLYGKTQIWECLSKSYHSFPCEDM